ncbi:oligosaccharide flippase family protein [uncultured Algoriphagus sp.]|uniref:oligosaccharide flippase family protein n=1 Tax=uncultured Algoriphagus sp. TaxID=417365 RepID=UPI00259415B8|nr:oligosaccharide flippase family protein [uncultured Algoriphagus sp.]
MYTNLKIGVFWNLAERFGTYIVRFVLGTILARLLTPSDYGVIAITLIIITICELFSDGGTFLTLIQRQKVNDIEYSTIFWFKLFVSIFMAIAIFIYSNDISIFFYENELTSILKIISIVFVLSAMANIYKIILTNRMDFKNQSKSIIISSIIGGIIGIIFGYLNFGVWALVYQTIIIYFVQLILLFYYAKWIPSFCFSIQFLKSIRNISFGFFVYNFTNIIYRNLYPIFFGKSYSAEILGLFNRAQQLKNLPEHTIESVINRIFFPILSQNKDNESNFFDGIKTILSWLIFLNIPIMFLLFLNSKELVIILLTEKWIESAIYLELLSISAIFFPINLFLINIVNVRGLPKFSFYINIFRILIIIVFIFLFNERSSIFFTSLLMFESFFTLIILLVSINRFFDINIFKIFFNLQNIIWFNIFSFSIVYFLSEEFLKLSNHYYLICIKSSAFIVIWYLLMTVFNVRELIIIKTTILKKIKVK